uniref:Uncharacterized protein n=1 Tax=Mycena chlorophos TaxID=658473 RepID=A0ABQ0KW44_MYCCL|nr:predicted protein [Mycena chlorophos]
MPSSSPSPSTESSNLRTLNVVPFAVPVLISCPAAGGTRSPTPDTVPESPEPTDLDENATVPAPTAAQEALHAALVAQALADSLTGNGLNNSEFIPAHRMAPYFGRRSVETVGRRSREGFLEDADIYLDGDSISVPASPKDLDDAFECPICLEMLSHRVVYVPFLIPHLCPANSSSTPGFTAPLLAATLTAMCASRSTCSTAGAAHAARSSCGRRLIASTRWRRLYDSLILAGATARVLPTASQTSPFLNTNRGTIAVKP